MGETKMNYTKEDLDMLGADEIRALAADEFGEELDGRIKDKAKLIEALLEIQAIANGGPVAGDSEAQDGDAGASTAPEKPAPKPATKKPAKAKKINRKGFVLGQDIAEQTDKVWVQFPDGHGSDGGLPITAAINGHAYNIPRNTPVNVPRALLNVLNDAKQMLERTVDDGKGGFRTETRQVSRFPYQVVEAPKA